MKIKTRWAKEILTAVVASLAAITASAFAADKTPPARNVVLMTSFDDSTFPQFFLEQWMYYYNYTGQLETIFRDHFNDGQYKLVVKHHAGASDIYDVLHDPKTAAVFWVSHAFLGLSSSTVSAIEVPPMLPDWTGVDITNAFMDIGPNVRWLSLVACDSQLIINHALQNGWDLSKSPDLVINGTGHLVDAKEALTRALTSSNDLLRNHQNFDPKAAPQCASQTGVPLTVTRHFAQDVDYPAVEVMDGEHILTVFPPRAKGSSQADQTRTAYLAPGSVASAYDLKIQNTVGNLLFATTQEPNLGELTFAAGWPGASWKEFSDSTGKPFGVSFHLYLYNGTIDPQAFNQSAQTYLPEGCTPAGSK